MSINNYASPTLVSKVIEAQFCIFFKLPSQFSAKTLALPSLITAIGISYFWYLSAKLIPSRNGNAPPKRILVCVIFSGAQKASSLTHFLHIFLQFDQYFSKIDLFMGYFYLSLFNNISCIIKFCIFYICSTNIDAQIILFHYYPLS